jgi:hypothetical protein
MTNSSWRADAIREIAHGEPIWRNLCLKRARTLLGVPAKYASAIKAWNATPPEERHTSPAPAGVPEFFSIGKFGHVVVADGVHGGEEWCFSTDIKRRGRLDRVRTSLITTRWGAKRLGWTETLNGVRVYAPPARTTLKRGDHGPAVEALQKLLHVTVDGQFGPQTEAAVNRVKTAHGGPADGIAGPNTWAVLEGRA